jgi:hypothetical protein
VLTFNWFPFGQERFDLLSRYIALDSFSTVNFQALEKSLFLQLFLKHPFDSEGFRDYEDGARRVFQASNFSRYFFRSDVRIASLSVRAG